MTLGTFLRYVCQVSDCPNRHWQMQDLGWCLFSSGQSGNWRPPWGYIQGEVVGTGPASQAFTIWIVIVIAPVNMVAVEVASIEAGMGECWKIRCLHPCWRGFVDVDYFIVINIHAHPLDLRCWWGLVD